MTFIQKLYIYLYLPYRLSSEDVDNYLLRIINSEDTQIVRFDILVDKYELVIKEKIGSTYVQSYLWVANYPYDTLSFCRTYWIVDKDNSLHCKYLWCDERPSKKVLIQFMEWLEMKDDTGELVENIMNNHQSLLSSFIYKYLF